MPKKYKLIAYPVTAVMLDASNVTHVANWCGGVQIEEIDPLDNTKKFVALNVPSISGAKRVQEGQFLVKLPNNDYEVMDAITFHQRYEAV